MFGLAIGGIASGVGKTTLTLGLIAALRQRGQTVQPFKVGPDFIDPSHHAQAAGRPSRNLDSWMVPEPALCELFWRAAGRADAAVVEGVMGLFDGRTGGGEIGSTAHVAKLLGLPVLLVVDAAKAARSVAATVLGCQALDPDLRIVGVVLNNVASARHAEIGREAIESLTSLPVLGWLTRDLGLRQEERYLGLVPAGERPLPASLIERATAQVVQQFDLDRLVRLANVEVTRPSASGVFPPKPMPIRARIAVARDAAFNFYYEDSLDLLAAWGAELIPFSPLRDTALPADADAVYLGGGFPELFAAELADNQPMLDALRGAAAARFPVYAECGGLMYLQERLIDAGGQPHQLVGALPGSSTLVGKRLTLGYREAQARQPTLLAAAGQRLRGHEFHWSVTESPPPIQAAYDILGGEARVEGFAVGSLLASYLHVHLASGPGLASRFVEAAARTCQARRAGADSAGSLPRTREMGGSLLSPAYGGGVQERGLTPPGPAGAAPGPLLCEYGLLPDDIEALSRQRIEASIGPSLPAVEPERGLVARLVYAAGDPELTGRVRLASEPIAAAVAAFRHRARLVVDVGMVEAGISRPMLERLGIKTSVAIRAPGISETAREHGITRSAAGILALADQLDDAIVAVGNAPTALLALLDLVAAGRIRPAVVIGMPVGFVAAEESKALLLASGLPCIVIEGTRGGSGLAAAATNYLLKLAAADLAGP
ncbi:MAG: cobyrinate a,c-diamide synthase [Chloroflexi bacterium]|nr:cobyrinate a,c-diamide synthase [Chloroflexota bacterium]